MEEFKCRFWGHKDELIIRFCINMHCQKHTQFCFKCLTQVHMDHPEDCQQFNDLSDLINKHIQIHTNLVNQYNDIKTRLEFEFEKHQQQLEQYLQKLKEMDQQFTNKSYISVNPIVGIVEQV